jgi:hypothetical protein
VPSRPADIYPDVIVAGQITYEPGFGHDLTFRVNGATGRLTPTGQVVQTGSLVCIIFVGG